MNMFEHRPTTPLSRMKEYITLMIETQPWSFLIHHNMLAISRDSFNENTRSFNDIPG
jgi:hypothetical protein